MSTEELKASNDHAELEVLKEKCLIAKIELSRVKSKSRPGELKKYVDDLETELGWALLDHREYMFGLHPAKGKIT